MHASNRDSSGHMADCITVSHYKYEKGSNSCEFPICKCDIATVESRKANTRLHFPTKILGSHICRPSRTLTHALRYSGTHGYPWKFRSSKYRKERRYSIAIVAIVKAYLL